jgi:hypothetical protein
MYKKESLIKRLLLGWGYWILSEALCAFLCAPLLPLMKNMLLLKFLMGMCTLILTLGLWFNWAFNAAKKDMAGNLRHGIERDRLMPYKMALGGTAVPLIMFIALLILKLGASEAKFGLYIALNIWMMPWVSSFADITGITVSALPWGGVFGIMLLLSLQPAAVIITYLCVYNNVDIIKLLFYKREKK